MAIRHWLTGVMLLIGLIVAPPAMAREPDSSGGRLLDYDRVVATGLPPQRLTIWLPPGYDSGHRRYPVLYMHDGQNLFDPARAVFGKSWHADRAMLTAMAHGRVRPHIIVGIGAPGADRWRQYLPQDAYAAASPALQAEMTAMGQGAVVSQAYLDWLTGPLKQWIDASFRTLPDRDHTAVAGSSMGGLMSCYAFLRRPEVYGRAACISSHWPATDPTRVAGARPELIGLWTALFDSHLGQPNGRRLWLDHGTATLDQFYAPYQDAVDARIAAAGWRKGTDWESRTYPGAEHEENAWAARLPEVLVWLLRP